ncbi:MAG TPA: AMP-binding protein [Pseudonocardia sp.]|nr:AMP-binding protein [Pseudonocardia sp.]
MTSYDTLRGQHLADLASAAGELLGRVDWSAGRLAEHRRTELRRLVRTARAASPWHRARLRDVDPDRLDVHSLAELPPMTKADLMANFDEIVTDDRLRLDGVEAYLDSLDGTDAYLLDRYHACASSGSSGRRGVFVYDWDGWLLAFVGLFRHLLRHQAGPGGGPTRMAVLGAARATHQSATMPQTFSGTAVDMRRFPVTLPLAEIVAGLNEYRPTVLNGYPTALYPLTRAAESGELRIAPSAVLSISEPLLPEIRAALTRAWNAPVLNVWGASEGASAGSCGRGPGLHLSDDLAIVELVDRQGRPVPPNQLAAKVYVTVLFNHTMPLIRYEITDELMALEGPCQCGSVFQLVDDPKGRLDDTFHYAGATEVLVHPHVFRSALGKRGDVLEYQVRQTPAGADVAVCCEGPVDLAALAGDLRAGLAGLGLPGAEVTVSPVARIERHASGKLQRFLPLPLPEAGAGAGSAVRAAAAQRGSSSQCSSRGTESTAT